MLLGFASALVANFLPKFNPVTSPLSFLITSIIEPFAKSEGDNMSALASVPVAVLASILLAPSNTNLSILGVPFPTSYFGVSLPSLIVFKVLMFIVSVTSLPVDDNALSSTKS